MGLDKLFSSRLAMHAVFDPSFTTINETKKELSSFDSTWPCDTVDMYVGEHVYFAVLKLLGVPALNMTV